MWCRRPDTNSMSKPLYTKDYRNNMLDVISDDMVELVQWSIHNDDHRLEEIRAIQDLFELLRKQMRNERED